MHSKIKICTRNPTVTDFLIKTSTTSQEIVTLRWLRTVFLRLRSVCFGRLPDISIDTRNPAFKHVFKPGANEI